MTKSYGELIARFLENFAREDYAHALALLNPDQYPAHAPVIKCWQMATLTKMGKTTEAIQVFKEVVNEGYWYIESALRDDPDFAALQGLSEFETLIELNNQNYDKRPQGPNLLIIEPISPQGGLLVALHGNGGNYDSMTADWQPALENGWILALPQSSQATWAAGQYDWNDIDTAISEIQQHLDTLIHQYHPEHIVLAGFSKGGEIAFRVAFRGQYQIAGLLLVDSVFPEGDELSSLLTHTVATYFVNSVDFAKYSQPVMEQMALRQLSYRSETTSNAFHGFPPNFSDVFQRAIHYFFE
ncbi:MAG: hypothetical protein DPW16_14195 [Chloroflexi bacterium]|nr:hypothetical protein [Chloroflexota bacterium]